MTDPILQRTSELLRESNGIVFGENHLTPIAPDWIRTNLASLKQSGVTTLFMEIKDHRQPIIDGYFSGTVSEADLRNELGGANDTAFENLIVEARAQGIRVVAMDLEDPTIMIRDRDGRLVEDTYDQDRLIYSNPTWARRVQETMAAQPAGSRYVMLAGADHTNKTGHPERRGVDDLLGIPSIDLMTTEAAQSHNRFSADANSYRSQNGMSLLALIPEDVVLSKDIKLSGGLDRSSDYVAVIPPAVAAQISRTTERQ